MPSVRLTVLPFPSVVTKVASRDALMFWAIFPMAKSHDTVFHPVAPAARYCGLAARRDRQLHRRRAFRTQPALVDGAVGITLDLEELGAAIAVLPGVGDQRAADRAVGADRMHLLRARDPQGLLDLGGVGESDVEAKAGDRQGPGARHSDFEETPTRDSRPTSHPH